MRAKANQRPPFRPLDLGFWCFSGACELGRLVFFLSVFPKNPNLLELIRTYANLSERFVTNTALFSHFDTLFAARPANTALKAHLIRPAERRITRLSRPACGTYHSRSCASR